MSKNDKELFEELSKKFDELFGNEDSNSDMDDFSGLLDPSDDDDFEEDLDNVIVLNDEDGVEHKFEFLDLIEYEGEEFVVLLPTEEEEPDADEVVILKLEDSDDSDDESYASVDDERTLNTVFQIFKEKFKDEFNFVD